MNHDVFTLFIEIAHQLKSKTAVRQEDQNLSYGDLLARSMEIGMDLKNRGVAPGDRVGLLQLNSIEFVISTLGVWSQGAVVLPLHSGLQDAELRQILSDRTIAALLVESKTSLLVEKITKIQPQLPSFIIDAKGARKDFNREFNSPVSTNSPALTQSSTGSTGLSKWVTRTHGQLVAEFKSVSSVLDISQRDRILGLAPFHHNYGFMNAMIASLMSGGYLFIVSDFFSREAVRLIEKERLTVFPAVPFMLKHIAMAGEPADLSSLRYILSAGAPLSKEISQKILKLYGVETRQAYGTTETGIVTINRGLHVREALDSVGFPVPGVQIRVSDSEPGPISIRSEHGATEYDNFTGKGESYFEGGEFFPGDLGCLDKEGRLTLQGRSRRFISVAGNKVDPTEVETVICQHPGVMEAVVLGVADELEGEKVKAVVVAGGASNCDRITLLKYCQSRLAPYKCPRIIEFRPNLPRSPLGKILKKYLLDNQNDV